LNGDPVLFERVRWFVPWEAIAIVVGFAAVIWFGFWTAKVSRRWGEREREEE